MTVPVKRGRPTEITREILEDLYLKEGLTDLEIARRYKLDRTAIVQRRRSYGIVTRETPTTVAGDLVKEELIKQGFKVVNLKETNKLSSYDMLIDNDVRIEVISASNITNGFFRFSLVNSSKKENIESEHRIKLPNGRTKKLFRKTCDFFVFCGIDDKSTYYWIIPSNHLPDTMQSLSTTKPPSGSKYERYANAWHQLKKAQH